MRIRLEEDGIDKYKVYLPDQNREFPIGMVWKDPFYKGAWKVKAYFPMYGRDKQVTDKTYDDFMKAARELANTFDNNVVFANKDLFDDDYSFSWDDGSD